MSAESKKNTVVKRARIVGLGTLSSRILGLVRESVIAAFFTKESVDAYQVAFMIPNSFRRLTAEGAFSISLTSVFTKLWESNADAETRKFLRAVYGFTLLFLTALTLAGVFGAHWIMLFAGNGFMDEPEKFNLAESLTRSMFPYIFFISLTATAMGLLNSIGKFFTPAFAPVLLNVAIIGCAVGLSGTMPELGLRPIFALAIGVLLGGVAQLLIQIPSLHRAGLLHRPTFDFKNPHLQKILRLTAPMIIGAAAYQFFNFISVAFATTLEEGSVMYITFAQRVFELPLAVLVMAVSTASLPSLSGLVGKGQLSEAKSVWVSLLSLTFFVSIPAMVALVVLAEPLIAVMYQRGHFGYIETRETAGALRWLAIGLGSTALLRQTTPFFYAMEKVKTPLYMTFAMIIAYVVAAIFFKDWFGHRGLCMAISVAATVQGIGLLLCLRQMVGNLGLRKVLTGILRTVAATIPMGGAVYGTGLLGNWQNGGNSIINIAVLGLCVVVGVVSFAFFAWLFKSPEFKELLGAVRKKK